MAIEVKIQRKLNTFELNINFKSDSKRIGILGASGCGKEAAKKITEQGITLEEYLQAD